MPRKKQTPKSKNKGQDLSSLITTDSSKVIVCHDMTIKLSNEKLRNLLQHLYETGVRNATKFHFWDCYGMFFSCAFALLITLLTTNFKDFQIITAACLEKIAWGIFVTLCLLGVASFFAKVYFKYQNEIDERDKAVKNALEELISANNQYEQHDISDYSTA